MPNYKETYLTPKTELIKRIKDFQSMMQTEDLDGALISQSADIVYFCGTYQDLHLYIPAAGKPVIMIRRNIDRFRTDSKLDDYPVIKLRKFSEIIRNIKEHDLPVPKRLGLELDVIPASVYLKYKQLFAGADLIDCSSLIRRQRAIKSDYEIARTKETAKMMDNIFNALPSIIKPGKSEFELAGDIEKIARREGHQGLIKTRGFNAEFYFGQLLSGPNSAMSSYFDGPINGIGLYPEFPFGPGEKIIEREEPVLFDYVGAKHGYIVDITRTFAIGEAPDMIDNAYKVAEEIQQVILAKALPCMPAGHLYDLAFEQAQKHGLTDYFMGAPYPVSFVGHGVGLELNELPVLAKGVNTPLEAGMIMAIEPKFVFPGIGGVGLENTFVMSNTGLKKLCSFPDQTIIRL
ncbi:Xaa-Pro aminopeptidase [Desulfotomaculum arcticum]|uniref:Xaa-Pro aminopeptidase n=1 Tax=Desulfotruncus arcticus DSM 17038 TaxID=1121424 RepID=A0A1I2XN50_9FIRM|nr:Xaa-Pro peptidase family protein [Desulfotruncus arcticus]SFH14537.1 Xaa-Pro aminopeptidase [Desulfotomaculum arcticum] [Desulfotruncus arcticus DSM 17038]